MFKYDPELMEKARWIVERGASKPEAIEVDNRPALYVPVPPMEKKSCGK